MVIRSAADCGRTVEGKEMGTTKRTTGLYMPICSLSVEFENTMRRSRYAMRWQQVEIPWYKERSSETQGIDARKRPVVEMEYKDIVVGNRCSRAS